MPTNSVTPEDLCEHAWDGAHVSSSVLRASIREIRAALGDSVQAPQYLETVRGRGYRFVGQRGDSAIPVEPVDSRSWQTDLVGRQVELEQLAQCLAQAMAGIPQLMFISGEAGIGKSALVNAFIDTLQPRRRVNLGRGQCIEHYGQGEAYLPFLDALGQFGQSQDQDAVVAALRRVAPSWLVHLPALVPEAERASLNRQVRGTTRTRMLREFADALDILTVDIPLVWVLEDLHWSDPSSIDLLSYLARRPGSARWLIVGTYRPIEIRVNDHPLQSLIRDLQGRGASCELNLAPLPAEAVTAYIDTQLSGRVATEIPALLHQLTQGRALFLVQMLDYLVERHMVVCEAGQWSIPERVQTDVIDLPQGLERLLTNQIEALSPSDQSLLEAASLAGETFAVAAVAAAMGENDFEVVEAQFEQLARTGHFIEDSGFAEWPDGTLSGCYQFQHALYRQVLNSRVGSRRRVQLHRRIGARLELGYGEQTHEVTAMLAFHFMQGQSAAQAIPYLVQASRLASHRYAYQETIRHGTAGLKLLATLPNSAALAEQELALHMTLGPAMMATKGFAAVEVEHAYTRVYDLCQQSGEPRQSFRAIMGLWNVYHARSELTQSGDLGKELLELSQRTQDQTLLMRAHIALGETALHAGDLIDARTHFEQGLPLTSSRPHHSQAMHAPSVTGYGSLAWNQWLLGASDLALRQMYETLSLAQNMARPLSLAQTLVITTVIHQLRREAQACHEKAEAALALTIEQGFPFWEAPARMLKGWALAELGRGADGIAQIQQGLEDWRTQGVKLCKTYTLGISADTHRQQGQVEAGLRLVSDGLDAVQQTGERVHEAELYRLKGSLLLDASINHAAQAETCFQKALQIAHGQQAKAWALRAATSLGRLWQQQGKGESARELLAPIYHGFTEGFETADLQDAKALLDELGA